MPFPLMILINVRRRILKSRHKWRIQHFISYYMRLVILRLSISSFIISTIITLNKFRLFVKLIFTFPWLISFIILPSWIIRLPILFIFLLLKLLSGTWLSNRSWFIWRIFYLNSCRLLSNFLINNPLNSIFFFIFQDLSFDFRFYIFQVNRNFSHFNLIMRSVSRIIMKFLFLFASGLIWSSVMISSFKRIC